MRSPNKKELIARLIADLVAKLKRVSRLEDYEDIVPRPNPPATVRTISEYEKRIGLKLPSSYRAFLELHNGYDWLAFSGSFLSVQDVCPGGSYYKEIVDWKKSSARYGLGEVLDGLVIAHLGQPNNWVYLDPNRKSDKDEMVVVKWNPSSSQEYPDLIGFLRQRIELCEFVLGKAESTPSKE
jgi:cell wall assembly regulator SMI1